MPHVARWRAACTALLLFELAGLPATAATAQCQLQAVELHDAGTSGEWLSIATDRPANFTSFKLSHPTRIVVDFAETLSKALKQDAPTDGPIARWSVESLGAEEHTVARLIVELRQDADYTVTSTSGAIELRLVPATARPLTALEGDVAPPAPVVTASTRPPAPEKTPLPTPPVETAEAKRQEPEAAPLRAVEEKAAQAEREKAAERAAQAEREKTAQAEREQSEAKAAQREREKAEAARLEKERQEKARQEQLAAAAAAKAERERAERERREKAEQARREARERAAAEKARRVAEARERAEKARQAREAALAKARAEKVARAEKLKQEREAREAARKSAEAFTPAILSHLGFHRSDSDAQVIVRFSAPVAYSTREEAGQLLLDVEHAVITVPNNRRELDTHFFGTVVSRIVPHEDRAARRVSIAMALTSAAPYEVKADGATLTITFHAPAASPGLIAAP